MKIWIISGEGMPVYGYFTSEEKATEAYMKVRPWDKPNQDNYGTWIYPLECVDNVPPEEIFE